jgi:hypothetical protein
MFNDYVVEVDGRGRTVWSWHANAHLNPDIDIIGPAIERQEWLHGNSLALRSNGNLLLTCRNTDSILEIDRKSGKIVSRLGNRSYLDRTTGRIEYHSGPTIMGDPTTGLSYRPRSGPLVLGGPHSAEEIAPGLPGAGNIICYDNGLYTFTSGAVEINARTGKLVWQSKEPATRRHFSVFMGRSQRLPNGNTFVCDGTNGRFYQQTAKRETVWEYVNPYSESMMLGGAVLSARVYSPDYCPQFKQLAAVQGPAVQPANSSREEPADTSEVLLSMAPYLGLLLLLLLGSLAWWKSKRR